MARRYFATIGDDATLSRVPRIPADINPRRERRVHRVLEVSYGGGAGALGSGGHIAGTDPVDEGSSTPSTGGCEGCGP